MKCYMVICIGVVIGGISSAHTGWQHRSANPIPRSSKPQPHQELVPEARLQDVEVITQTGAATAWRVLAKQATFSEAEQQVVVDQVAAKIFRTHDRLRITAAHGLIDRVTGNLAIEGRVRFQPRDGYTIETDELRWLAADRTLYTDDAVTIRGPSVSITGIGLRSQVDQHRMTLQRQVRAAFRLPIPR